jgi:hypothetical protein
MRPGTAGGKYRGLGLHVHDFAGFDADRDDANHGTILVLHEIGGKPLVEEHGLVLDVVLVERVQQRVPRAVRRGAGARRLPALAEILRLPAKGTLVDTALFRTRERQPHVLEFEDRLRAHGGHVLDRLLVADVVGPLDRVVHVPAPVVVGVGAGDGAGDAALGRDRVRAGRENLGDDGGLVTRLGQLQRSAHTGAAAANDDAIK